MLKKRISFCWGKICCVMLALGLILSPLAAPKASAAGFRPGNIISDGVMANSGSMNVAQIDSFLRSKCALGASCLYAQSFGGRSAAQVIWQAAQDYGINPQVLLVLLQKEQSLVMQAATATRLRKATGYGCPDTAACDSRYYGFENQVRRAAELFRTVLNGGWSNYPAYTTTYIQYHPNKSCGGTNVYVENRATSALYRYTPYQPNAAALAGGGDGCSSYGNRNFYNFFTNWFGSTGSGSSLQSAIDALNSTYYLPHDVFALKIGENQALEFIGSESGVTAQIGSYTGDSRQLFTLERSGKYYYLRHVYSGKYVDVANGGTGDGNAIHLWDKNDTCAQQWAFESDGEAFELRSACSAKNLDVRDGLINQSGNTVHLWSQNDTIAQKWTLFDVLAAPVADGDYQLGLGNSEMVVSLPNENTAEGTDLKTGVASTATSQTYQVRRTSEGLYTLQNQRTGMYLDVENAGGADGTPVQLWSGNGTCAQKWIVERDGEAYQLKSSCSEQNLDVSNGEINRADVKIQIWQGNGTVAQLWYFKDPLEAPLTDGKERA